MIAFFTKCPQTALKEPLGLELTEPCGSLPAGTYAFAEFYCANLECNCQRVTLCVYASTDSEMRNCLAQIGFGWESPAFYGRWLRDAALGREAAGVSLSGPPNNKNARFFMDLLKKHLADNPWLVARFKRHYAEFREAIRREQTRPKRRKPALMNGKFSSQLSLVPAAKPETTMKEYTFTITVEDFSARILLGGEWSLYDFADFITRAVGFHFDHLFEFLNNIRNPCKSTERYSLAADMGDSFDDLPDPGVKNTMVSSVFTPRKAMLFHFDFGDDWWFLIRCDSITDSKARRRFFKILSTKGTPPEQYPDLEGDDDDWEEEMDEEPAIPRAVAGKKPGKTLDQLIAEMAGWPEDWSTFDKKTRALATGLVREFEPFLRHLGEGGLAPKTLKNHHDNLWLLGELIIRDAGRLGLYTAPSAAATLDNAITGGEGPMIDASRGRESSDQRDLERTTRKLAKFRGLQVW